MANQFVVLKGVYQEKQAGVVQLARREVKLPQLGCPSPGLTLDHHCEDLKDVITKEVLVADQCLYVGGWEHLTQLLEAIWSNFVERHIQLFEVRRLCKTLRQQNHALITNYIAFDIQRGQSRVLRDSLSNALCALRLQFIELDLQLFNRL